MSGKSYSTYNAVRVVCPFYKGEDKAVVRCESPARGGTLIYSFPGDKRKRAYMRRYCEDMKGQAACPIHRMMQRVWTQLLAREGE